MPQYLLIVDFQPGIDPTPMEEWEPEEIAAHLDYYRALNEELEANGEIVGHTILTGPDVAKVVRGDGVTAPVVTDGPFQEFKEWIAGFQVIDVESDERAVEIAARVSAVPGRGGVPLQQPIQIRRVMDGGGPSGVEEMQDFLATATGETR